MARLSKIVPISVILLFSLLTACASSPIKDREGEVLYTQVNLWAEDGDHITTNYHAGKRLPINTRVKILFTNAEVIKIQAMDSGETVYLYNEPGYSGKNIEGIYYRYFGQEKVDLSEFDAETREMIKKGRVQKGMSRDAVLLARGYPPSHRTPSLDKETWTFWRKRMTTQTVTFSDGEVSKLKGF